MCCGKQLPWSCIVLDVDNPCSSLVDVLARSVINRSNPTWQKALGYCE